MAETEHIIGGEKRRGWQRRLLLLVYPGEDGKSKHGEIMVACLTSFGHAAEPKEVGRIEEEITFGTRIGVSIFSYQTRAT